MIEARNRLRGWLGVEAGDALYDYLRTATRRDTGAAIYPDLDEKITQCVEPAFFSPPPVVPGAHFDVTKADRFIRFSRRVRHVKGGRWAGRPVEPDMWQIVFIIAPLFCWLGPDGLRIRRTLYLETAKKQGKSTFAAVLALYLLTADNEPGAEVVSAAGDKDQARAVFDVAWNMVLRSPALAKRLRLLKSQVTYEAKASWYRVVSSTGQTKAGLNLHGGVIDELLVQKTRDLVDNLEGATASREQPIIAYLTTGGIDTEGSIYNEKRNYSERVAQGEITDATWLAVIYSAADEDDWTLPEVWRKANPGLGISVQLDYLARKCEQAKANPASQNTFKRDHLAMRTGSVSPWLDVRYFDQSGARWLHPREEEFHGCLAYGGLDLAFTSDLAAFSFLVPHEMPDPDDPELMVTAWAWFLRAWTPEATIDARTKRDQIPYDQWVNSGWLTATPGNVIDYDFIEDEIYKVAGQFQLRRLHFDRWGSKQILSHIRNEMGHYAVYEMGQGFASMSQPMKDMERAILQGRVRWGGNPILRHAVKSLRVRKDAAGNIKPDRDDSVGRIDPFVAGTMAMDAYSRRPVESRYESA